MMPKMDGIEAVRAVAAQCPTPVLLTSVIARYPDERARLGSFGFGQVELVEKPMLVGPSAAGDVAALVRRARALAFARGPASRPPRGQTPPSDAAAVAIAASTGGMPALADILRSLPEVFPPLYLAQHLDADFIDSFVRFLRTEIGRPVQVVEDQLPIEPSRVYVAQRAHHLLVRTGQVFVKPAHPDDLSPSADLLFRSVAKSFGKHAYGIVLTGMGRDGAYGLRSLRESGAWTIAQEPSSALVSGMPSAAVELGACCEILTLPQIAARLAALKWKPGGNR
ncbi:MAG TPA: chemotaxis protein CheB [Pseudomonadota bacterium]|jgi:chemotaxis response regulator CheB|nr:chemotaxis protein CheB [Pseudomonadota bacterium]HNN52986.1 chemotaxis protein CheB [Pseudomonadota bacterium]HNO67479.1 chemotaxis protein CheB [Pseudomonadota bacterium]